MSNSINDFIADVMSGDEGQNSNPASDRRYQIESDDETVVAGEDGKLSSLLSESENIVRSLSNLSTYKMSVIDDKKFERKPWQSLYSLKTSSKACLPSGVQSTGTSDYVSDEHLLTPSARTIRTDSRAGVYSNQNQVQTFSNTTGLLQILKDELVMRTSELHRTENEFFNLKANYENLNGRFEIAHSELSTLRSQVFSKDKQIRTLTDKVASLSSDVLVSREDCQVARSELENMRVKLEQCDQTSDQKNESLSREVRRRDEVIETLRNELTECTRNSRTSRISDQSDNQWKEKVIQFENAVKTKEQKILAQQRQIVEYEHELQGLKDANIGVSNTKSEIGHLHQEIELLKEQLENARTKNISINETLSNSKRFYEEFKETSEKSIQDYARISQKLKTDYRELEEKHRESLSTIKQRGDANKKLNDDIKELTDKLKGLENHLSDKDKSIHALSLEKIEFQQKIETMKSKLVEESITESNMSLSYKKELENKLSYIDQLSKETIQLNRSIDDLNDKIRIRDTSIEELNNKLVELEGLKCSQHKSIQKFEETIYQLSNREKILEENNKEHENKIELLQLECKKTKERFESAQDEINKISLQNRELERDLQRKEQRINQGDESLTYEIESLKLELKKVNQLLAIEHESVQSLTSDKDRLLKQYTKLNKDFDKLSEDLENKDTILIEWSEKEIRLLNHNSYLEDELTKMKLALEDSSEELDKIRKSWDSREDALAICKEESSRQKANNLDLIGKIEQRDQLLQSLTTETGKLKQKHQNKTTELAKVNDQNTRLKEALKDLESSTTGLNQRYEEMKNKKETEINHLKAELEEVQNQYSSCYDELIQRQEHSTKYQTMEKESSMKLSKLHEEMSRQQMDYDEMESEFNVIRGKHRACQEELSRRDEELLMLRVELQNCQRDIISFQAERPTFQKEIERWREKFTDLQDKFQNQQLESESMEDCLSEKDHKIDELLSELKLTKQENTNQGKIVEQLKADLTLSKSTNSDRYNHFQAIIESLKTETGTKNQEARFLEENCSKFRNEIGRLRSELEMLNQTIAMTNEQMEQCKAKLQSKDDECQHWIQQTQSAQYLNEEVKISLDALEKEISQLKQVLDNKDSKIRAQSDTITKLTNEKSQHSKTLNDCQRQLDMISRDKEQVERNFEDNVIKIKKYEKCIRDLNEELAVAQVEMSNLTNKITRLEAELSQSSMITSHKDSNIETLECKLAKMKSNFSSYKNTHKSDDTEVENLNSLLLQQTKKCADTEDILNIRNRDREIMITEKENRDKELLELKERFFALNCEIDNLRKEREEKCFQLEDIQKKYQYEIKKLKHYSKEVEDDMGSLHHTIDDMQRQLDYKEMQAIKDNQRILCLEQDLEQRKKEILHLEQRVREYDIDKRYADSITNAEVGRQFSLQKDFDQLQNEMKESRVLILELTNQKTKFETKCTGLEAMLEKADKKATQSDLELKKVQSLLPAYAKELDDLRQQHQNQAIVLEKTKEQYGKFTEEFNSLKGEKVSERKKNVVVNGEIDILKQEVTYHLDNVNMLREQTEKQEEIIIELQNELLQERKNVISLQSNEYQKKKALSEMETQTDVLTKTTHDLTNKLKVNERLLLNKQDEIERLTTKVRQFTELMMEKDNKIRLAEKKMEMMEREHMQMNQSMGVVDSPRQGISDRSDYINDLESTIRSNQTQLEQLRSEIRQINNKNYELSLERQMLDQDVQRLKDEKTSMQMKLTAIWSNKEESHDVKNRAKQCLEEENESLQRIVRKLRYELEEKDQQLLKNHDDSIKNLTLKLSHVQDQDVDHNNKIKQIRYDLELKNKQMDDLIADNERLRKENLLIISELEQSEDRLKKLKCENSTIVENFNTWVQEQKIANERLGEKIREQNKTIHDLKKEKENFQGRRVDRSSEQRPDRNITTSISSYDQERNQIGNDLRSAEDYYEKIIQGKNNTIEELKDKMNDHVTEITKLNQQITISQNDLQKMRIELDRAKDTIESYKTRRGSQNERLANMNTPFGSSSRKPNYKDRVDGKEYDGQDKQYWIQRVGELTDELQQCREYWSSKFRDLSNNVESSSLSADTLTPISS